MRLVYLFSFVLSVGIYLYFSSQSHLFPYNFTPFRTLFLNADDRKRFLSVPQELLEKDLEPLINFSHKRDVDQKRETLIQTIWGGGGVPDLRLLVKGSDISDPSFSQFSEVKKIDHLQLVMEYGMVSNIYHFSPVLPTNGVVIYHQGHRGHFKLGVSTIRRLLTEGFEVYALAMPLIDPNPYITVFGNTQLTEHEHLKILDRPYRFFLEPVIATVNRILARSEKARIAMVGISGGGWTAVLAAAVDKRIQLSFPVAGTMPLFIREFDEQSRGDWEQYDTSLYSIVNYLELYVLGSTGIGRSQLQIYNRYDSCCFPGLWSKTFVPEIEEQVQKLQPGEFEVFIDESHWEHKISTEALDRIVQHIAERFSQRRFSL